MYKIIHISSGIIAATFNDKRWALDWIEDNSIMPDGVVLSLYKIIKG